MDANVIWFPLLKFVLSWVAVYAAIQPILQYVNDWKALSESEQLTKPMLPTTVSRYIPLILVALVIAFTPFKFDQKAHNDRVITSFDSPVVTELPVIEVTPRTEYGAPDNAEAINRLLEEKSE